MITRRELLIALGASALAAPFGVLAQAQGKLARIGFLGYGTAVETQSRVRAFQAGLSELGYREGTNIVTEFRWADGNYDRLPGLAAELVRLNVDAIVTHGTPGAQAAQRATATIAIILATSGDPVELGFANSLARPGKNITGSTLASREIAAKRLELLKQTLPNAKRYAILENPNNRGEVYSRKMLQTAAGALKIEIQYFQAAGPAEIESAFLEMAGKRIEALTVNQDAVFIGNAKAIGAIAARRRIPAIGFTELAEAGALLAYGASIPELFRRAAYFVDRVLKGARPGDLPIEQPTKFELVVNLKSAKTLGITIPQSILVRADKVIE
jgi:putative ABC transport system substrate-binding protein